MQKMTKADRARNLRYKRPALASLGYDAMLSELQEINDACSDVQYYVDSDDKTLLNALDGDEEAEWEFKMVFADLSAKSEDLFSRLDSMANDLWDDDFTRTYDDCTVALIGDCYRQVGYDTVEEDYFHLTAYEEGLAQTEAGKRLTRKTKAEMLNTIGRCMGIMLAFFDLRQQYDYLKATMDILRDENTSLLQQITQIEEAYEKAESVGFAEWEPATEKFNRLLDALPDKVWVE